MKVFYSWQMDAPRKINKDLIHGALRDAIVKLGEELEVAEAERGGIELDHDTQGVLGSPEVARVIFEKIASARVVVMDVSLVATGKGEKPHINSNVAIELGYAYGKVGDEAVLKVMNTHFGEADDLPFDLRSRRHPVQYHLAPGANAEVVSAERKKLSSELADILKRYLESTPLAPIAEHVETPWVGSRGRFWEHYDVLVPKAYAHEAKDLIWAGPRVLYFRCIPKEALPVLSSKEAVDMSRELRPLVSEGGWSHRRNEWGAITFDRRYGKDELIAATQLFKNREIWAVDVSYAGVSHDRVADDPEPIRIIPTAAVNRQYPEAIDSMRQLAVKLGYGDQYTVEMGLSGGRGVYLAVERLRHLDPFLGPFFDNEVYIRSNTTQEVPTGKIMDAFWVKLFAEVGQPAPTELLSAHSQ